MSQTQTTIIPHSQEPYVTRVYPTEAEIDKHIENAVIAQKNWSRVPLEERITIGRKFMVNLIALSAKRTGLISSRMSSRRCLKRYPWNCPFKWGGG